MEIPPLIKITANYNINNPVILLVCPKNLPNLYSSIIKEVSNCKIICVEDSEEEIFNKVSGVNAIIGCPRIFFNDDLIEKAGDKLFWVHSPGAGIEHLLTKKLIDSDIIFTNGRIIQGPECADHALALLLSLSRKIINSPKDKKNQTSSRPIELLGKNAAVIGVGGIGMCIAERLSAFGVNVYGVDESYIPMVSYIKKRFQPSLLPEFLPDMDIVCFSAPHTPMTHKMINLSLIKKFKHNSYFINVSRGGCVDLDALVYGLEEKILAGVGIDVTDPEPLPKTHKLFSFNDVII